MPHRGAWREATDLGALFGPTGDVRSAAWLGLVCRMCRVGSVVWQAGRGQDSSPGVRCADFAAVLDCGARRGTRSAPVGRCAQTTATGQKLKCAGAHPPHSLCALPPTKSPRPRPTCHTPPVAGWVSGWLNSKTQRVPQHDPMASITRNPEWASIQAPTGPTPAWGRLPTVMAHHTRTTKISIKLAYSALFKSTTSYTT